MSNEMMAIIIAASVILLHAQLLHMARCRRIDSIALRVKGVHLSVDDAMRKLNLIERKLTEKATVQN